MSVTREQLIDAVAKAINPAILMWGATADQRELARQSAERAIGAIEDSGFKIEQVSQ